MNALVEKVKSNLAKINFEKITEHPNILIAARVWDDDRYQAAKVCYKFMRMIDDLIDDRKAENREISCPEKLLLSEKVKEWIDCLEAKNPADPFIGEVKATIKQFKIPLSLFHRFARSMQYDIDHQGFATFNDFLDYAEGASVAPASVFVHLCCLKEKDGIYEAPAYDIVPLARPCAIYSYLVHIIRDFEKDQKNNLNYFALDILEKNGLDANSLKFITNKSPVPAGFREVVREYMEYANRYNTETLMVIDKLVNELDPQHMLSLFVIHRLYRKVYKKIKPDKGTFTGKELNLTPDEIRHTVYSFMDIFNISSQTSNIQP